MWQFLFKIVISQDLLFKAQLSLLLIKIHRYPSEVDRAPIRVPFLMEKLSRRKLKDFFLEPYIQKYNTELPQLRMKLHSDQPTVS